MKNELTNKFFGKGGVFKSFGNKKLGNVVAGAVTLVAVGTAVLPNEAKAEEKVKTVERTTERDRKDASVDVNTTVNKPIKGIIQIVDGVATKVGESGDRAEIEAKQQRGLEQATLDYEKASSETAAVYEAQMAEAQAAYDAEMARLNKEREDILNNPNLTQSVKLAALKQNNQQMNAVRNTFKKASASAKSTYNKESRANKNTYNKAVRTTNNTASRENKAEDREQRAANKEIFRGIDNTTGGIRINGGTGTSERTTTTTTKTTTTPDPKPKLKSDNSNSNTSGGSSGSSGKASSNSGKNNKGKIHWKAVSENVLVPSIVSPKAKKGQKGLAKAQEASQQRNVLDAIRKNRGNVVG